MEKEGVSLFKQLEDYKMIFWRGAWVAPLVKHLTLDFLSGHDLTVWEFEAHTWLCRGSTEPAWDSVSHSLPLPYLRSLSLSLSLSKCIKNK